MSQTELDELAMSLWTDYGQNRNQAVIFALEGPLGAGKTTFTKALARAMGITDNIVSPTFILHRDYPGFDHIDAWRIERPEEITNLGLGNMIEAQHVIVIEWADKFKPQITNLKSQALLIWIKFDYTDQENARSITYENISH